MSEQVADYFLFFSYTPLIAGIFLLCLFTRLRRIAVWALSLLFFTMVYNLWLKGIWRMPLPPALNNPGFAFPSGHMHVTVVFYGAFALALRRQRVVLAGLTLLIVGVGVALVVKGYHYVPDVVAATGFGCLSLGLSKGLASSSFARRRLWLMPLLGTVLAGVVYGFFLWAAPEQQLLLGALSGLILLTAGAYYFSSRQARPL